MMGFMLWMAGSTVHIFSIGITFSILWQPISALRTINAAFEPFKDPKVDVVLPKMMYAAVNLFLLSIGLWKLNGLGLLPTRPADWISSLPPRPVPEFSSAPCPFSLFPSLLSFRLSSLPFANANFTSPAHPPLPPRSPPPLPPPPAPPDADLDGGNMRHIGSISNPCLTKRPFLQRAYQEPPPVSGTPIGQHRFVMAGGYRIGANQFAAVGHSLRELKEEGGSGASKCYWIALDGGYAEGKVRVIYPAEHHWLLYETAIYECTLLVNSTGTTGGSAILVLDEQALVMHEEGQDEFAIDGPPPYHLAFCSYPMYRHLNPKTIQEWLQIALHYLGVEYFVFNDGASVVEDVYEVLEPYMAAGMMEILDMRGGYKYESKQNVLVLNNCLYRMKYVSKWAFFADFDEFLHIQPPQTLKGLLQEHSHAPYITFASLWWSIERCRPQPPSDHFYLERMPFHWPHIYCIGPKNAGHVEDKCINYFGHRKVIANTKLVKAMQASRTVSFHSARPFDILVIGGGATGAGVALDAAARGLHVAMVERDDFSCGTSSRSTKLVHGGVRYLEKAFLRRDLAQLRLVNEALAERGTLIRNAPHLVWPLPTLTPCYHWWEVPYYWAGLKAYDLIAGKKVLYMSRVVTAAEATGMVPTLAHKARDGRTLKAGVLYYDGQMDDARLNLALATTAARAGAVVLNHASVSALKTDPTGRVEGAVVKDELTGKQVDVRAKVVVNATGAYCDSVRRMADPNTPLAVLASSGSHVVLPDFYLGAASGSTSGAGAGTASGSGGGGGNVGLLIPKTADGRVMFMLPWLGRVVAGTTDAPSEVVDVPVPTEKEVQFIVDTLSNYLNVDVRKEDVLSVWGGLRPLLRKGLKTKTPAQEKGEPEGSAAGTGKPEEVETEEGKQTEGSKEDTSNVVREHTVMVEGGTLVTVTGGKWTTYRSMAEDTVNTAIRVGNLTAPTTTSNPTPSSTSSSNGSSSALALPPSVTEHLPLTGAAGFTPALFSQLAQNADVLRVAPDRRILPYRLDSAVVFHLVRSYGTNASKVKEIATTELLAERLAPGFPDIEAEVIFAARNEFCETAADFLCRRSRIAFLDADAAMHALPRVVKLLAKEHGWDSKREKQELEAGAKSVNQFRAVSIAPSSQ
ncbi:unnamed protein product [Closterium sp. NIES-54]